MAVRSTLAAWVMLAVVPGVHAQERVPTTPASAFKLSAEWGQTQYRATERNATGGVTNQDTGSLPRATLAGRWQQGLWFAEGALSVAQHDVAYQGFTQMGIPLSTTTELGLTQGGLHMGTRWQSAPQTQWQLAGGLERLQIRRNIRPSLGSLPLREVLTTTRAVLSMAVQQDLSTLFAIFLGVPVTLFAGLDVMPALRAKLDVDSFGVNDPITLSPARGTDWRVKLKTEVTVSPLATVWLGYTHESFQPGGSTTEVWTRGGVPISGVRYPGSQQSLRTLALGASLAF